MLFWESKLIHKMRGKSKYPRLISAIITVLFSRVSDSNTILIHL